MNIGGRVSGVGVGVGVPEAAAEGAIVWGGLSKWWTREWTGMGWWSGGVDVDVWRPGRIGRASCLRKPRQEILKRGSWARDGMKDVEDHGNCKMRYGNEVDSQLKPMDH